MKKVVIYTVALLTFVAGTLSAEVIKTWDDTNDVFIYDVTGSGGSVIRDRNVYTHESGNNNLYRNSNTDQSRTYYNYDLTTVTEGVLTGASLTMDFTGFDSTDAGGLSLRAFAFDGSDPATLYRDIGQGAGTLYSGFTITDNGDGTGSLTYNFTAAELAEIMASFGGLFSLGLSSSFLTDFNITNANLTLTVAPEPAEVLLMLAGLGVVLFFHLKRRKVQSETV